jgi:YD repeat-containing protein
MIPTTTLRPSPIPWIIISYTYNTFGMLSSVTHPVNQTTSYSYDDLGRISMITHPDYLTTSYQYDTYGNLSCITDTNHRATKYQDYNDFSQPQKIFRTERKTCSEFIP